MLNNIYNGFYADITNVDKEISTAWRELDSPFK